MFYFLWEWYILTIMINIRFLRIACILVTITLFPGVNALAQDTIDKNNIIILPLEGKDTPTYIPMIVEKLFKAKIDKTEAYFIFDRDIFDNLLEENEITLPKNISDEIALEIGTRLEINHILYGKITQLNDEYIITTKVLDSETGSVISEETANAADLKGLETAVAQLTRSIVKTVLPEELVENAVQTLDNSEQTDKEAEVQESISEFEKLAEENPEEALALVGEPAREAIKDTIREEVVDEEIQTLYDNEKAETALVKKRKRQFWTMFTLEGFNQLGNLAGSLAAGANTSSLYSWSKYMNDNFDNDPYNGYLDSFNTYRSLQTTNYIFSAGGNIGLTISHTFFLNDVYSFSKAGRYVYAASYALNILGNAASVLTNTLSFKSLHYYSEYSTVTTDFTSPYQNYRDWNDLSRIARYTTYSLWGAGLTGMLTASLLPGEKTPMILSSRARLLLTLGGTFLSIGNVTSGLSVDYRGRAETAWINEHAKSGWIGPSLYDEYKLTSDIFSYSSYGMFALGGVLTYLSLIMPSGNGEKAKESEDIVFTIVPDGEGFGALVSWRY